MMNTYDNKDDKKSVYRKIEFLRKKLNDMLASKNFVIDEEIICLSKKLDELLNVYSKLNEENC